MPWILAEQDNAIVVSMNTNAVNAQNQEFFKDLHDALDRIEREHAKKVIVFTSSQKAFSAGLDFKYVMPLFGSGDQKAIENFFREYIETNLRLFNLPRPTIAAVNGHAIAGGLITALMCDHRVGAEGSYRMGLNEVPIGIPMPASYVELLRHAVGDASASVLTLSGRLFSVEESLKLGVLHEVTAADSLLEHAIKLASGYNVETFSAYAFSKRALRRPAMTRATTTALKQDEELVGVLLAEENRRARADQYERVTGQRLD